VPIDLLVQGGRLALPPPKSNDGDSGRGALAASQRHSASSLWGDFVYLFTPTRHRGGRVFTTRGQAPGLSQCVAESFQGDASPKRDVPRWGHQRRQRLALSPRDAHSRAATRLDGVEPRQRLEDGALHGEAADAGVEEADAGHGTINSTL